MFFLDVAARYSYIFLSYGNIDVVAPTSAPIFVIVPLPVQLMLSVPSPKYSIIFPVPPLTVKIPASFSITSFADAQLLNFPVNFTPIIPGQFISHKESVITSTASAPPTPIATIPNPPALGV